MHKKSLIILHHHICQVHTSRIIMRVHQHINISSSASSIAYVLPPFLLFVPFLPFSSHKKILNGTNILKRRKYPIPLLIQYIQLKGIIMGTINNTSKNALKYSKFAVNTYKKDRGGK